ncbi:DUF3558 family protein [Lentzea sp. HUAS12]|uniref:DUF3558 family protein n=1 Tax=Lentzea sp. HUAS12 TaxID=2951806 RepID=UPI00209C872B|nr:DUF3558 family protein [Lentzea sp. HUAS12]USX51017.1 DUF3558 family protein [Lentzea sp. HUAS12]
MNRLLGIAVLCAALTACTAEIPGPPPKPVPTTSPRIDKPRNLAAFDPCKALPTDGSQWFLDPPSAPPAAEKAGLCKYTFGTLTVLVSLQEVEYDEVKKDNPNGHQGQMDGHTIWFACDTDASKLDCGVWAAVGYARTLTITMQDPDSDESWMLRMRTMLVQYVLDRLPKSS